MAFKLDTKSPSGRYVPLREVDKYLKSGTTHRVMGLTSSARKARANVGYSTGAAAKSLAHPVSKAQSLNGSAPKARPAKATFNGGTAKTHTTKTPAVYPKPKVRVATRNPKLALEKSTPPMPRATSSKGNLKTRLTKAFAANKGNNQKLALERMKKASRK